MTLVINVYIYNPSYLEHGDEGKTSKEIDMAHMDLSGDRVILTQDVLDPLNLPGNNGFYLEVIAYVCRTKVGDKVIDTLTRTDPTNEFSVHPFQGSSSDFSGDTSDEVPETRNDESGSGAVGVDESTQEGGGNQCPNTDINDTTAATDSDGDEGRNSDDPMWQLLDPAVVCYLLDHPEEFEGADEVYVVIVPYIVLGYISIRFLVRKDVQGATRSFLTTPPLAFLTPTGGIAARSVSRPMPAA
ncbi:uncharacterized protein B0H18DRAFT_1120436 [Fomitopsis serialis]|uniref:uncharacterized protein n=1 Tax=Fomitopsis serialis TaxID=139415 RepID=UPI002008CF92|nr:uncharacterized protein B0H18DRAFT_1120436 [Neoantrodia serialis]KAH9923334.1 hypothetical protein B0H18DRAFT_1120436 [Neoantrodia serialis]